MQTWFHSLRRVFRGRAHTPKRPQHHRPVLESLEDRNLLATAVTSAYRVTDLVANHAGEARFTDPNLVNAWGLASNPAGGPIWVADNGTGVATVYNGDGVAQPSGSPLVVTLAHAAESRQAYPTCVIFNGTSGFVVSAGGRSGPSSYLFVSEDGTISGYNATVDPTHSILAVDNSSSGANYKGVALGNLREDTLLYAADFHNNRIAAFNRNFTSVIFEPGAFTDPNLPANYAPFNIQNIGGKLFVAYAQQDADAEDEVAGPGLGAVDVYDTEGNLLQRLAVGGTLNAPWGFAQAPTSFGKFGGALLVGNFGDGKINAFNTQTGAFLGQLADTNGNTISIDGLWGLMFGNGTNAAYRDTLYFAAGPEEETDGRFGKVNALGSPTQRYVAQLERDLFASEANTVALNYFGTLLRQGMSRLQLVQILENTTEHRAALTQQLYLLFLHRPADQGGLITSINFLAHGGTVEQLAASLVASDEYFKNRGGSTNTGFVQAAYQDLLGRPPTTAELQNATTFLARGGNRLSIATALITSPEGRVSEVQAIYLGILRRPADPVGLAYFVGALQRGATSENIQAALLSSPEYNTLINHDVNRRYIKQLYSDLLDRSANDGEADFWGKGLDLLARNEAQTSLAIENSPEGRTVVIRDLYLAYLNRLPDAGGLALSLQYLARGGTREGLIVAIASSPEYLQINGGTNLGFLQAFYQDTLIRPLDTPSQNALLQAMARGVTRAQVAAMILNGDEYRTIIVQSFYNDFLDRTGNSAEVAVWVNALRSGARDELAIAGFTSSDEYFLRF